MADPTLSLHPSGDLLVHFPGKGRGNWVRIPCTETGLRALRTILQERERSPAATIGMRAVPIQAMINAFMTAERVAERQRLAEERRRAERSIPLDLISLEGVEL